MIDPSVSADNTSAEFQIILYYVQYLTKSQHKNLHVILQVCMLKFEHRICHPSKLTRSVY